MVASRGRRERLRDAGLDALAVIAGVVLGAVVGTVTTGWVGAVAALVTIVAWMVGRRVARRAAQRRGAAAWDWQAGRHRLLGRPAQRVQDLDRRDRRPAGPLG